MFSNIWTGLALSRVEMLVWFALLDRLCTMDKLKKFNIIRQSGTRCVLCNLLEETSNHLFLHSEISWNIWCDCINFSGLSIKPV